jgi:hypothetical protein
MALLKYWPFEDAALAVVADGGEHRRGHVLELHGAKL